MNSDRIIEEIIIKYMLDSLYSQGLRVAVADPYEKPVPCKTVEEAMKELFAVEDDTLLVWKRYKTELQDDNWANIGWIRLIYGNGFDVLSDHNVSLGEYLSDTETFIDEFEDDPVNYMLERHCKMKPYQIRVAAGYALSDLLRDMNAYGEIEEETKAIRGLITGKGPQPSLKSCRPFLDRFSRLCQDLRIRGDDYFQARYEVFGIAVPEKYELDPATGYCPDHGEFDPEKPCPGCVEQL